MAASEVMEVLQDRCKCELFYAIHSLVTISYTHAR